MKRKKYQPIDKLDRSNPPKQVVQKKKLRAKDYPARVSIIKTRSNNFRYTIWYPEEFIKLKAAKTYPTHASAYRAAVRAIKAHHLGEINFIE